MKISINDQPYEVAEDATLDSVLAIHLGDTAQGFAVAVNHEVIARAQHARIRLKAQDTILIIQATQGG